jgi:hypothetical protein
MICVLFQNTFQAFLLCFKYDLIIMLFEGSSERSHSDVLSEEVSLYYSSLHIPFIGLHGRRTSEMLPYLFQSLTLIIIDQTPHEILRETLLRLPGIKQFLIHVLSKKSFWFLILQVLSKLNNLF